MADGHHHRDRAVVEDVQHAPRERLGAALVVRGGSHDSPSRGLPGEPSLPDRASLHALRSGEPGALETLLRYNLEDVIHLPALLACVYNTRISQLPFSLPTVAFPPPPPIPFGFDEALIFRTLAETGRAVPLAHYEDKASDEAEGSTPDEIPEG